MIKQPNELFFNKAATVLINFGIHPEYSFLRLEGIISHYTGWIWNRKRSGYEACVIDGCHSFYAYGSTPHLAVVNAIRDSRGYAPVPSSSYQPCPESEPGPAVTDQAPKAPPASDAYSS